MANAFKRLIAVFLVASSMCACGGGDDNNSGSPPPVVGASDFNLATAVVLMQLSLESYQMLTDYENGTTFTLPSPYTLQETFLTQEHYSGEGIDEMVPIAFVATSGSSIYVVFRGTKTISEWISDATATQVDYTYVANGGKTETGFTDIYATIRSPILQKVTSLAAGGSYTALYITGHSLGAALAVLAAPDLAAHTDFHPVFYNFAGPRAGDPTFATLYDGVISTSWRVVNTYDEVPMLPPTLVSILGPPPHYQPEFFFYEHVDTEYDITFGGPIHSVADIVFNHSSCNYYATLCGQTSNPTQCKQLGQGLNDCDFS